MEKIARRNNNYLEKLNKKCNIITRKEASLKLKKTLPMKKFIIPALCTFILTGCISREQADNRLERGCKAAADIFSNGGYSIKSIKKSTFASSKEFGDGYRDVKLTVIESDSWADLDKDVECVFIEEIGVFGTSHSANLHRLIVNGETYGVKDANTSMVGLFGNTNTHIKVSVAVEKAMKAQK